MANLEMQGAVEADVMTSMAYLMMDAMPSLMQGTVANQGMQWAVTSLEVRKDVVPSLVKVAKDNMKMVKDAVTSQEMDVMHSMSC